MNTLIKNGLLITGDGKTEIEKASVLIKDDRIEYAGSMNPEGIEAEKVIDASDCMVFPGVINAHTHGCTTGPLFPSGSQPLSESRARENAEKMLRQGVTTLVNLCGFATVEEVETINRQVAINIKFGTGSIPKALQSALSIDGSGLRDVHKNLKAVEMAEKGAVAIGEIGSGASLGGGITEYKYIPEAIERITGIELTQSEAIELKEAVLGKTIQKKEYNENLLIHLMEKFQLDKKIEPNDLKALIIRIVYEPIKESLDSFEEACKAGVRTGLPVVFHNSLLSAEKIYELAKRYGEKITIVAGHCNHPSFKTDEALLWAGKLKETGVIIDISTLESIITRYINNPHSFSELVSENLVDTISTDYGGGHWDSILEGIHYLFRKKIISLPKGIAMATGNVANLFPKTAPNRGFIQKGKIADIIISSKYNISRVEKVIISGRLVVNNGWLHPCPWTSPPSERI